MPQATIARRAGVSQRTVSRWLAAESFPERKPRSGDASALDPFKPFLLESWQAGCQNGTHLWRLIQGQGFAGSYGVVADFLAPLRRGEAVCEKLAPSPLAPSAPPPQWYTPRQAAFLFLRPPTELTPAEQDDLLGMQAKDDSLTTIYALTQDFASMVRERHGEQHLDGWLDRAATSDCPKLQRFANGVRRDYAAVRAGLKLEWSQGPVEGQVTRLKLVKRQMYGRAKLDLLRQRVLNAA
jgi:transposase